MRCVEKVACAGARRPRIVIHHGGGLLDTVLETAGRAAGKVAAAVPAVAAQGAQKLLAAGKASLVPALRQQLHRSGATAGRAVADRAANLLRVSKADAVLPSAARLRPSARKALTNSVQKRAQALLGAVVKQPATNVSNIIHGQGLRLSPY